MATKITSNKNAFERAALQANLLEGDASELEFSFVAPKQLFYRHVPHMDSLVFAPPDLALRVSQIHDAFRLRRGVSFSLACQRVTFRNF